MTVGQENRTASGLAGVLLGMAALGVLLMVCLSGDAARAVETAADLGLTADRPAQTAVTASVEVGDKVVPMGRAVGIKLFSDGVLVVGMSPVETAQGLCCPGKDCGLKTGDIITHVNGKRVTDYAQMRTELTSHEVGDTVELTLLRLDRQTRQTVTFDITVVLQESR